MTSRGCDISTLLSGLMRPNLGRLIGHFVTIINRHYDVILLLEIEWLQLFNDALESVHLFIRQHY